MAHRPRPLNPLALRRWPAALLAGALLLPLSAGSQAPSGAALPSLGDGAGLSISAERRLGDSIARDLYRDPDYLDDPVLVDYLQALWQPLLGAARARGDVPPELSDRLAWQLLISRDKRVNAFALPGGYLGVHLGLVAATDSAPELASVLAHELSHVSQRHIARMLSRQDQVAPWVVGAMILGVLAARANADVANAAIAGGQAVAIQNQLNFSRDMEREADRIGWGVFSGAGFAPAGMAAMFEKLDNASRLNDSGAYPYLRTHPLTVERLSDIQNRAREVRVRPRPDSLDFQLVRSRLRVLQDESPQGLRDAALHFRNQLDSRTTTSVTAAPREYPPSTNRVCGQLAAIDWIWRLISLAPWMTSMSAG